ncbi:MAG: hypothetical protein N4J56_006439 [Chroococcidiopsis sp. SAG 2025]|uniref:phage tail sheath family protein n=1 Tax=Chroococcidiopsis sp. SAG 2025 TaxID=171389 RepID=UPI0029373DCF|nr:phage tail sheath subtilisin-like domain-containing protein [Chroococcidiopsis sp. SAG 2025]MDV2996734.1 hypothetical protein [Chroococcidiopsis sp. SAG 2025]
MVSLTNIISQSPGVYVSEERSAAPIAGVGTSTAGFIGIITRIEEIGSAEHQVEIAAANAPDRKAKQTKFKLPHSNVMTDSGFGFFVDTAEIDNMKVKLTNEGSESFVTFTDPPAIDKLIKGFYRSNDFSAQICTNFTEFKTLFGDFIKGQPNLLAHAVFGFFRNGGTRCYVVGVASDDEGAVEPALKQFEAIDEIAIVAAPGLQGVQKAVKEHCETMGDRVAILDPPETAKPNDAITALKPFDSDYAALYLPWLLVFDPANPKTPRAVPPSGHMAGIYARVDSQRGVFKAPANEVVAGAVGLAQSISKSQQDGLNKDGINCIRNFNGNIRVWGARTLGGDANGEFKYISTRRLFNYLRESVDEGTQWTVFEPNSPELWARIRRSVTAFLTVVWRSGALFGSTPEEAFYVKCDAENNPPEQRQLGLVVTDIGVAVVKPAEFVVFRLSQRQEGQ